MVSKNWLKWNTMISRETCISCNENNGRIYAVATPESFLPPLHEYCRCYMTRLPAILAGTATARGTGGADWWLKHYGRLPDYYITKREAKEKGWIPRLGNLADVFPEKMIGGDIYSNRDGKLPSAPGRIWYEADIDYIQGYRNDKRILFSNDGLLFTTGSHYGTFIEVI